MAVAAPPLLVLIGAAATGPLALNIFVPSMPGMQDAFGVTYATVQLTLTLYLVGLAVSQLFMGSLSDRFGRRPVLLGGLLVFLLGTVTCALATHIVVLIAGRIVQAVGGCAGLVLGRAIARDVHGPEGATRMVAYITMAMVVVPMIAPALGGFLEVWFHWRASFWMVAVFGGIVFYAAYAALSETNFERRQMPGIGAMLVDFGALLRNPDFCAYAFATAFSSGMFFAFLAGAPFLMIEVIGAAPSTYGLFFVLVSVGYMAGNFCSARLSGCISKDQAIAYGCTFAFVGGLLLVLLAVGGVLTPLALFGPMAIIAFGNGLTLPNALVAAIGIDPRKAGTASGLAGCLQMGLGAIATVAVGHLDNQTALPMATLMFVSSLIAIGALLVAVLRHRRGDGLAANRGAPAVPEEHQ